MRSIRTIVAALLLFTVLAGIGYALIPPPPAEQVLGIKDSKFDQYRSSATYPNQGLCRSCHTSGVNDRHHNLVYAGAINPVTGIAYGCNNCHPVLSGPSGNSVVREKECLQCHSGLNWSRVDPVNASAAKVNISRPHHIKTAAAAARHCNDCHGSVIADYDDGHYVPDYSTSNVTPTTHYKVYNATSGRYWGGCFACHQNTTATEPDLFNQHDTHHAATNGQRTGALDHQGDKTPGETCNWCHTTWLINGSERPIGYPNELAFEIRNSTLLSVGDTINGTGCEKCHDVGTIHNIQVNYGSGTAGKGHIETNWDCLGCHAWYDAGTSGFENVFVPQLDTLSPGKLATNVGTTLTLVGSEFLTGTGTTNPVTAVVAVDGVEYTPSSVTDTQIVVNVPGQTAGVHTVQVVKKGDWAWQTKNSKLMSIVAVDPVDALSAVKTKVGKSTTITIDGTGFGPQPDPAFTELGVTVTATKIVRGKPVSETYNLVITSWSNTQIVGTVPSGSTAPVSGNPVTVNAVAGSDTVGLS